MVEPMDKVAVKSFWLGSRLPSQIAIIKSMSYLATRQQVKKLLHLLCRVGSDFYDRKVAHDASFVDDQADMFRSGPVYIARGAELARFDSLSMS